MKKVEIETDVDNCYFSLPSNDCFTYLINETIHVINNQINNRINNNYLLEISKWFLNFLEKDKVLNTVNSLDFAKLLIELKQIAEGKSSTSLNEVHFLSKIKRNNSYKYFNRVVEILNDFSMNDDFNFLEADEFIELFINESLARGIDIRFINCTIKWFNDGKFKSFKDFLNYFLNQNSDSYDIYLPIKNFDEKDLQIFKHHDQELLNIDNNYYLKIYKNKSIDFYSIIKSNMTRIESIINTLKLYTNSSLVFDYEQDVLINISSKTLINIKDYVDLFKNFVIYRGVKPFSKYMHQTIDNLFTIEENDKERYHKLLNIVAYSEKDNDFVSPSSYVDLWISLESLFSLSSRGKGLDPVKKYLPLIISSKIIVNKLSFLLKNGYTNKTSIEDFVLKFSDIDLPLNSFYGAKLSQMKYRLNNIKSLMTYYNEIEKRISIDCLRIYMLRNEYVHESNLNAWSSLQFYKLRNYLTLSLDAFFMSLNNFINNKKHLGGEIVSYVFDNLIQKNEDRETAFLIFCQKRKYNDNKDIMTISEIGTSLSAEEFILNVIFNNSSIIKKFKEFKD